MESLVKPNSVDVIIDIHKPFVVIGEKINPTGRKKLATEIKACNYDYVLTLDKKQIDAGADILDVNVGVPGIDEAEVLPKVAKLISESFDVPLCPDSASQHALAASMALPGKPLINSVNRETKSLEKVLPLVKEYNAAVIGLTMDDDGIPNNVESRVDIAEKILNKAAKLGINQNYIVIDPLVSTVGADSNAVVVTLGTIELIRKEFGVNINLGASNISFGLPDRDTINLVFLALAIGKGSTCAITDPIKIRNC